MADISEEFPVGTKVQWIEYEYDPRHGAWDEHYTGVVIGHHRPPPEPAPPPRLIVEYLPNPRGKSGQEKVLPSKITKIGGGSRKKSLRRTRKNRNRFYEDK